MENISVYSGFVQEQLKKNNGDLDILKKQFKAIIAKTIVNVVKNKDKCSVSYFDDNDGLIYRYIGDPEIPPRIGKVEVINKRETYLKEYNSKCYRLNIKLSYDNNTELINFIDSQPNKQGFILNLVRKELERQKELFGKDVSR